MQNSLCVLFVPVVDALVAGCAVGVGTLCESPSCFPLLPLYVKVVVCASWAAGSGWEPPVGQGHLAMGLGHLAMGRLVP